jgi:hypothetical protein
MQDVKRKASGLAKGSLICGICTIIPFVGSAFSLAAIIMGIIDLVNIKNGKSGVPGKKLDITGIILAVIFLPISFILLWLVIGGGALAMSGLGSAISGLFTAIFRR